MPTPYRTGDLCYYLGKLYRVQRHGTGPNQGRILLRLCGHDGTYGDWGCATYNGAFPITAWITPENTLLHHG